MKRSEAKPDELPPRPAITPRKLRGNAVFSDEEIADALWVCRGLREMAARRLGASSKGLAKRIKQNPSLEHVLIEARELQKDRTESKLFKAIDNGESWAIQFYLKTQARDRGYIDAAEYRIKGQIDHQVTIVRIQDVMAELEQDDQLLERARQNHPHLRLSLDKPA